jgi:hypothetical protein
MHACIILLNTMYVVSGNSFLNISSGMHARLLAGCIRFLIIAEVVCVVMRCSMNCLACIYSVFICSFCYLPV